MNEKLSDFNPSEHLKDADDYADFINQALETGDSRLIARCLSIVLRSARSSDLNGLSDYAINEPLVSHSEENPLSLNTFLRVARIVGIKLIAQQE